MRNLTIGNITLKGNLILAPMAGVTDLPFRLLCKEQGADLVYTEMISAKGIYYNNKNTAKLWEIDEKERPVSLQLFGSDPKIMSEMAAKIEHRNFDILDINMGCPVPKVVNNGEGSALMKDPKLAGQIVKAISNRIQKPVTVKFRKGFNDGQINAVEFAKYMEENGAAAVAVHGRTREEYYSGKADWEINLGLDNDIFCFNVESAAELEILEELAAAKNKVASIALRINPEVDAHTHAKITTGMKENKFGINLSQLGQVLDLVCRLEHIKLIGIHCHIGSQITDMAAFRGLVIRVNEIQEELEARGIKVENLNFGGGLGIDYYHPNHLPIPAFDNYFAVFNKLLQLRPGQQVHFEPGRSIVAQCGSLISKVLYVKVGETKKFCILDAGFTELIRPAMYDAYHRMENITSDEEVEVYDVVGPICESSDVFGKDVELNRAHRGDLIALRSAGAYGEVMASQYNCRKLPTAHYSDTM